jgi:putative DNA primase/helicase
LRNVSFSNYDTKNLLINFNNGTLNLSDMQFYYHNLDDHLTVVLDYDYDADADCPNWKNVINKISNGDKQLYDYLQEFCGYLITGLNISKQMYFIYGGPNTGKSTFINILSNTLQEYAGTVTSDQFMSNRDGKIPVNILSTKTKRLLIGDELDGSQKWNSSLIKQFTGRDKISIRPLYSNSTATFIPTGKLVFVGNNRPYADSFDEALWKRMRIIPFLNEITIGEIKKTINSDDTFMKIFDKEKQGIMNWCIEGYKLFLKNGLLDIPSCMNNEIKEYKEENDPISEWISSRIVTKTNAYTSCNEIYNNYCIWCNENNRKPISNVLFFKNMTNKFGKSKRLYGQSYKSYKLECLNTSRMLSETENNNVESLIMGDDQEEEDRELADIPTEELEKMIKEMEEKNNENI